jgi:predicted ATPase
MPILEALRQLCQPPEGHAVVTLLTRVAPTWLLQMPWLLSDDDAERLQRLTLGATPQRMLREIVQALEALTATRPLVFVLEDLHWSDAATLDVLSLRSRRQETARLLLIGTYRPEEVRGTGHSLSALVQDLQRRGYCQELTLPLLSVTAVRAYLTARFPGATLPEGLAQFIHTRSDGNPLFMIHLVEYAATQGVLGAQAIDAAMSREIPHSLCKMIEQRLDQLTPKERQVCEVASVAGTEFTATMVAAGMGESLEQVEVWCTNLVRRGLWLRSHGPQLWPDGTTSEAYSFVHALYQTVLYAQITTARRQRLHRLLGERLERGIRRAEE